MIYSIKPEKHDLENARNKINQVIESYSYAFDTDNIEFYLNWQKFERPVSFEIDGENSLLIILNSEMDWEEEIDEIILRGIFSLEFMQKADFDQIVFNWQDLLLSSYTVHRSSQILGGSPSDSELTVSWTKLREKLSEELFETDFDSLYENTGILSWRIGQKLLEEYEIEDFPGLKRSDVIKAGDEVFQ